jgi:hypothetical protein
MSKKNNVRTGKTAGKTTSTPKVAPAPVVEVMTNAGVELSTAWRAIRAGLVAVRGVARTPEAIQDAVGRFLDGCRTVAEPSDGSAQTGRVTGLRIMEFQDRLYGHNMMTGWGFTDAELATAWRAEFPTAKCNFAAKHAYITSARTDLNRNRRGTTIEQLRAQYKFDGPVNEFKAPIAEPAKA